MSLLADRPEEDVVTPPAPLRRSRRPRTDRRQIARTIVSERVWAAIATRRGRRRIESDSDTDVSFVPSQSRAFPETLNGR